MIKINRKLALLTLHHLSEKYEGRFHPDKSQITLSVYRLEDPDMIPKSRNTNSGVERRIQMQLENSQVLASKTFEDARTEKDIIDELVKRYDGVATTGVGAEMWSAAFRVTATDRILHEYFLNQK
ncbi:hypothetical protein GF361_04200 [Candidatus Woesearchaeota archaeon]|nr:hypothetical protein [Candidatus Woesearchaeota archaeon]